MRLVKTVVAAAVLAAAMAPGFADAARYGRGGGHHFSGGHYGGGYRIGAIGAAVGLGLLASAYYAPRYYAPRYYAPPYYPPAYYPPAVYAPDYGYMPGNAAVYVTVPPQYSQQYAQPQYSQQYQQPQYQQPQYQQRQYEQQRYQQPQYEPQQQSYGSQQGNGGYFCASSNAYYPQARQCPEGWQQVEAQHSR